MQGEAWHVVCVCLCPAAAGLHCRGRGRRDGGSGSRPGAGGVRESCCRDGVYIACNRTDLPPRRGHVVPTPRSPAGDGVHVKIIPSLPRRTPHRSTPHHSNTYNHPLLLSHQLAGDPTLPEDFREFTVSVWNYCTFELKALVKFAFSLFDLDGSGWLDQEELEELVKEVYGDGFNNNVRVQRIVDKIDENGDGKISFGEFQSFNKQYPALLFPAFEMQQNLRRRVHGSDFWEAQTILRYKDHGRSSSIFEILSDLTADSFKKQMDSLTAVPA